VSIAVSGKIRLCIGLKIFTLTLPGPDSGDLSGRTRTMKAKKTAKKAAAKKKPAKKKKK
jgi:hypothetical protein